MRMNNITLIGMPGAGKSTVGVVLSKILNYNFTDTDLLIQRRYGKKLYEIANEYGTEGFFDAEMQTILDASFKHTVIATGGSVIYRDETMRYLKEISTVVYIDVSLDELQKRVSNLFKRGVVAQHATTIPGIYKERCDLYEKYADIKVTTNGCTLEQSALKIADALKNL